MAAQKKHLLVRIKPENKRDVHSSHGVTIKRELGWHRVPEEVAEMLRDERMSELEPERSALVFDVCTEEEAAQVMARQERVEDPAGTVAAPREVVVGKQGLDPRQPPQNPVKPLPGRGAPPRSAKTSVHAGR